MPREISDAEFAEYERTKNIAYFAESIFNDPALNNESKALIKKKYPHLAIADYDLERKFEAEKKKLAEERDAERRKADEAKWAEQAKKAKEKHGFTDDGWKKVEDFMVERNIPDYEVAAAHIASLEPKASEPTYDSQFWNYDKRDTFKEISKDPEGWARTELLKAAKADENRMKGR